MTAQEEAVNSIVGVIEALPPEERVGVVKAAVTALEAITKQSKRVYRGESGELKVNQGSLTDGVLTTLKDANTPLTTTEIRELMGLDAAQNTAVYTTVIKAKGFGIVERVEAQKESRARFAYKFVGELVEAQEAVESPEVAEAPAEEPVAA